MINSKRIKKIIFNLVIFLIAGCLGLMGVAIAASVQYMYDHYPGYFNLNYKELLIFSLLAAWISLLIHELSHLVAYKIFSVDNSLLYVFPLCFFREDGRLKVKLAFNLAILFGGICVPNFADAIVANRITKLRRAMYISLLAAPLVSIIIGLISIFGIYNLDFIPIHWQARFYIFFLASAISNLLFIGLLSLIPIPGMAGDFFAAYYIKKHNWFYINSLYTLSSVNSENERKRIRELKILFELVLNIIEKEDIKDDHISSKVCSFLPNLIREWIFNGCEEDERLENIVSRILEVDEEFWLKHLKFEAFFIMFTDLLIYLALTGRRKQAQCLWREYIDLGSESKIAKYNAEKAKIAVFPEAKSEEANQMIKISALDSIFSKRKSYYDEEKLLNSLIGDLANQEVS